MFLANESSHHYVRWIMFVAQSCGEHKEIIHICCLRACCQVLLALTVSAFQDFYQYYPLCRFQLLNWIANSISCSEFALLFLYCSPFRLWPSFIRWLFIGRTINYKAVLLHTYREYLPVSIKYDIFLRKICYYNISSICNRQNITVVTIQRNVSGQARCLAVKRSSTFFIFRPHL
jgi:hypothetical protein